LFVTTEDNIGNKYLGYENEEVCFIGEPDAYGVV
jgi:hypothetical protein